MQQDFRALAWRHMWLSWWWGVISAWFAVQVREFLPQNLSNHSIDVLRTINQGISGAFHLLLIMLLFLGLPALLGALVRLPAMHYIFKNIASLSKRTLCTVLVFESSMIVSWLLWELLMHTGSNNLTHSMQRVHLTLLSFFTYSLPWLLSSVAAAWWLGRRQLLR